MACVGSDVDSDIPEKNAASLLQGKLPRFRHKDFHQSEPEKGEEGKDLLTSQQNLKLLSETTGATNGHFLVHNGENVVCYSTYVKFHSVGWEVRDNNSVSCYLCRQLLFMQARITLSLYTIQQLRLIHGLETSIQDF